MLRIALISNREDTRDIVNNLYKYVLKENISLEILSIYDVMHDKLNNYYDYAIYETEAGEIRLIKCDYNIKNILKYTDVIEDNSNTEKTDSIMYIYSNGAYTTVVYEDKRTLLYRKSLKEWQSDIIYKNFIRINKRYLVNLKYIKSINKETTLRDGTVIVTKRGCIKEYKRLLEEYRNNKF